MHKIPITKPYIDDKEIQLVEAVLKSGWLVQGDKVKEFEQKIAEHEQVSYCCATTSCTTALQLAMLAEGMTCGMDVFVPSFTFVATANAVTATGATPILIDIDETTYIDNLGRPVKVCFLKNEALLTEYQGRIYKCDDPIKAFGWDSGEFKYERLWDFISEPYELYMRDKKELQRKCPKLYDYIKEVVE